MNFRLVPNSVTMDDNERRNGLNRIVIDPELNLSDHRPVVIGVECLVGSKLCVTNVGVTW